jgi:hypothetical protein
LASFYAGFLRVRDEKAGKNGTFYTFVVIAAITGNQKITPKAAKNGQFPNAAPWGTSCRTGCGAPSN